MQRLVIAAACASEVTVEISFGGPSWAISPADFRLRSTGPVSNYCYGAFYSIPTSSSSPQWIIGDAFLASTSILVVSTADCVYAIRKTCIPYSDMTHPLWGLRPCPKQHSQ